MWRCSKMERGECVWSTMPELHTLSKASKAIWAKCVPLYVSAECKLYELYLLLRMQKGCIFSLISTNFSPSHPLPLFSSSPSLAHFHLVQAPMLCSDKRLWKLCGFLIIVQLSPPFHLNNTMGEPALKFKALPSMLWDFWPSLQIMSSSHTLKHVAAWLLLLWWSIWPLFPMLASYSPFTNPTASTMLIISMPGRD